MKYLALIYNSEKEAMTRGEAAMNQEIADYGAYEQWLATDKAGARIAGEALQPTSTATTLRIRNGKLLTTDGPFAETKEQLGGFYLLNAPNLDEAIKLAARIPTATYGCVEVRPIMDFPT